MGAAICDISMSLAKTHPHPQPQIHDGYATIRSRGSLRRTRSQAQRIERKSIQSADSEPIYDSPIPTTPVSVVTLPLANNIESGNTRSLDQLNSIKTNGYANNDNDHYDRPTQYATSTTFKVPLPPPPLKIPKQSVRIKQASDSPPLPPPLPKMFDDFDNEIAQSIECIDTLVSFDYLPPLKSPQYINELNTIRSKGPEKINFYQRPESPSHGPLSAKTPPPLPIRSESAKSRNGRLGHRQPSTESVPPSPTYANTDMFQTFRRDNRFFNDSSPSPKLETPDILSSTVLSRNIDNEYATLGHYRRPGENIDRKPPPGKGPFKKSFSVRGIDTKSIGSRMDCNWSSSDISRDTRNGFNFSSSDISDISSTESYGRIHHNASSELIYMASRPSHDQQRRYATLAHPMKRHHPIGKSTGSLNEFKLRDEEILDCKIGCQSTLRSKPRVPWYELAIKKENRQSCPPLQVKILFNFLY